VWSVVVPTHDRVDTLRRVLAAYERQTPAELDFEVVVVDDGSSDGTAELLASLRPRRYRLRFAVEANRGPAAARNRALELASGERVLFTGDDVEPAPDLLHRHQLAHRRRADPSVAVLGLTRWPPSWRPTATMRHVDGPGAQQFSYHYMEAGAEYDFRHLYTSNVSLHRHLLDAEPGPFSTDFPAAAFEDAELGYRLARRGLRIFYHPEARADHHHRYDAAGFFRRQERCGRMAAVLERKLPELRAFLDLETLDELHLELATDPSAAPRLPRHPAEVEARSRHLAGFFDPFPFDAPGELLHPLFRYAYLKGLAAAVHTPETADRLTARLAGDLLLPGLRRFRARLRRERLPHPEADFRALLGPGP